MHCISLLGLPQQSIASLVIRITGIYFSQFWSLVVHNQGVGRAMLPLKPGKKNFSLHLSSFWWFARNPCPVHQHLPPSSNGISPTYVCVSASLINFLRSSFHLTEGRPVRLLDFCELGNVLSNFCGESQEAFYTPHTFSSIIYSEVVYSDRKLSTPLSHLRILSVFDGALFKR